MDLAGILDDPVRRARFVQQGTQLVRDELADKSGLAGMALRAGFKAIQTVAPDIVERSLDMLLPHFAPAVQPHVDRAVASGDLAGYFASQAEPIAEAMLAVTDERAERSTNALIKRTYAGLRPMARAHTAAAMPRVGALLATFR